MPCFRHNLIQHLPDQSSPPPPLALKYFEMILEFPLSYSDILLFLLDSRALAIPGNVSLEPIYDASRADAG